MCFEQKHMEMFMTQVVIAGILFVTLNASGTFRPFMHTRDGMTFGWSLIVSSLAHAFVEEYVFRVLFWKHLKHMHERRTTLLWLNVSIFWVAHVVLLNLEGATNNKTAVGTYTSASYQLTLLFAAMMFNAIYLDAGVSRPYVVTVSVHAAALLVWGALAGGNDESYYRKYRCAVNALVGKLSRRRGVSRPLTKPTTD